MEIKLSVAIPTYNGAQTIRETLDSIVSQLEEGVEIVVSDNASTIVRRRLSGNIRRYIR